MLKKEFKKKHTTWTKFSYIFTEDFDNDIMTTYTENVIYMYFRL
jgi:hypothetical protein